MAINLDQVLHGRAGWRLRFLVPCWVFQVAVLLGLMGVFAYRLVETFEHYDEKNKNGRAPMVEVVWEATNVGFSTVSLVLSIIEISKMATESLTPFLMLCTHIIKLTLSFAILGLDITVYLQRTDEHYSIVALALDCGLLAVTMATFIYSLTTFRRLLKYEDYAPTHLSSKRQQRPTNSNELELGNKISISAASPTGSPTGSASKRFSLIKTPLRNPSTEYASTTVGLKGEVDRAIGVEFGWGAAAPQSAREARSGVVVGRGTVPTGRGEVGIAAGAQERRYDGYGDEDDDRDNGDMGMGKRGSHHGHQGSVPIVVVSEEGGHEDDRDTERLLPGGGSDSGGRNGG